MFQVSKIKYNLRHFQKIANAKKKLCKNRSRDNILRVPQLWNLVLSYIKMLRLYQHSNRKIGHGIVTVVHVGYAKHALPL